MWMRGCITYAVEMGLGAKMHITSVIRIRSSVQKIIGKRGYTDRQTDRQRG
jgi:hypothetical protein